MVVAALAYPASGLFLPGRIDHHALQMVLILGAVLALLSRATFAAGAAIGLAAAGSLTVGMETVPFFGVIGVLIVVAWIAGSVGASGRLLGVGIGTITGLLAARLVFAPLAWDFPACDGFDAASWRAALFLAAATCLLAATKPAGIKPRLAIAGLIGAVALAGALIVSPTCRSPYGMVDPLVARWWLAGVAEAQPLLQATPAVMLGQAGLLLAGIAAGAWWTMRTPDRSRWGAVLAVQTAAFALALVQLRGTYVGALLAAPALAAMISVARTRGAIPLVTAWLASAGVLYPLAARAFEQPVVSDPRACDRVAAVDALAALPPMRVLAPVDLGAAIIARTHHVAIAGPYHRNTTGNRAALLAFLGPGARVGDVVTGVSADAILWCAGTLGDRPAPPGSIGAGAVPPGFHTTPVAGHGLLLWPSRGR
ncbi:hypothetical protein KZ810_01370 [Sphingomonas sp. RHCKR47]|uniref:hypothetical protein n=1 Tax=Sphingomonas citricola TaxID=2862498 RepID=UPI001CA4A15A|nr:hypothetical protein [Sphingomonas citricola]MBW6522137.1 hypothetical protein [Sphingomonas citricola]